MPHFTALKKLARISHNGPSEMWTNSEKRTSTAKLIETTVELVHYKPPRSGRLRDPDSGHDGSPRAIPSSLPLSGERNHTPRYPRALDSHQFLIRPYAIGHRLEQRFDLTLEATMRLRERGEPGSRPDVACNAGHNERQHNCSRRESRGARPSRQTGVRSDRRTRAA